MKNLNWFYCDTCCCPSVQCEHCKNTSCNGGGCDKCVELFEEANKRVSEGNHPPYADMPFKRDVMRWSDDLMKYEKLSFEESYAKDSRPKLGRQRRQTYLKENYALQKW